MKNKAKLIPLLFAVLFLAGCPEQEKPYITAEEQYLAGWVLHNINDETPTSLDYSKEDFAIYNYSYNFPASQPDSFGNALFWIKPSHVNESSLAAAPIIRLGVPLDRAYYIMGQNPNSKYYTAGWSFSNYVLGYSSKYIEEHYLSENPFGAIEPNPLEKKSIAFGKAPYTPASLIVKDNRIRLNGHVLRGYDNNSYLIGYGDPKPPRYEVFVNDTIKAEGNLVKWDPVWWSVVWSHENFEHIISENGKYKVKLFIETDYPVWDDIIIESSFTVPSDEMQPPELQHIEASPYFIPDEEYNILVDLHDESGIENVEINAGFYTGGIKVIAPLSVELKDAEKSVYEASFIPDEDIDKIGLEIKATDIHENSVAYNIEPIALPAQSISFSMEADKKTGVGKKATVKGKCKAGDNSCNTFLVRYYLNNEFLKTDVTSRGGAFELEWEVPLEYNADEINFTVKYEGTGIYLPHEEKITIPLQAFGTDIGIFDLKTGEPILGEPINVSAIVKNLGSSDISNVLVRFEVDEKVLDEKIIPLIESKKSVPIEFEWQPIRENSYNIELEAIAENDEDLSNNFLEKEMEINYIAPDITGFIEKIESVIINLESGISFFIFNNGEKKANDLKATLYAFYKPQGIFLFFPGGVEVIETPGETVEEPIEQPAKAQDKEGKEKEEETPSEEPTEGEPSPAPGGGGTGSGGPTKPISITSVDYNGTKYNFLASADGFELVLNVSTEKFNETINFTYNERIKKLQNDIYIFADFYSESSISLTIGNASLIKKDLNDLDASAQRIEIIKWTPTLKGEHFLLVFVNTSKDSNFETNYFGNYVKVLREGVNIQAEFMIDYEKTFVAGNETNITTRITNLGTEEAKNMRIALFEQKIEEVEEGSVIPKIKKKEIGSKKLDSLGEGKNEELKFSWTPSKPGENFLLLIAETKGDINPEDNDDNAFIDVISESADINSYFDWITRSKLYSESIFANEEQQIIAIVRNRGKSNTSDVSLSLYESIDEETRLVEKKGMGVLKAKVEYNVEFNWTPSKNGRVELKLEGLASNDNNQENNNDSIIVDVLVRNVDVEPIIMGYPEYILVDEVAYIWVMLRNFGIEDVPVFNFTLSANGAQISSRIYENLGDFDYNPIIWIPLEEGTYELEASINLTDANLQNNVDKDIVEVFKTKDVKLGFVDKDGNNAERILLLGNQEALVNEPVILKIPDTKLKMWIGAISDNDQVAASIYSNTIIENTSITSAHLNEPVVQDGLVLYEIFANNDSWDYESFSSFFMRSIDTLDIRYTELEGFYCTIYNFSDDTCKEWKDVPLETLVSRGDLIATIDTAKATAIALGDKDYDNDNSPDWDDKDSDNDGIDDEQDTFTCFNGRLKSREEFNITVNESSDTGKQIKGKNKVGIKDKDKKIVEFNANFDNDKLDCREIAVEKQPEVTTRGYTLIKGISLLNETKTAYVDKIAGFNRVCVKDEEVDSIDELSQNCDGSNELMVMCDGSKHGNYTCTNVGSQYKVDGLIHSAVVEPTSCQESWSCTDWSSCKNDKQIRTCTDTNACGTSFNKPSEKRSCDEDEEEDEDEDEERSGSLSRNTFDLGEIKGWSDGKSRTLKLGEHDLIIFTFDNKLRSIELEQIKATKISIKLSWSGKSIDLTAGKTETFDIDNDKKDDIKFTFETISRDKATIVIERTIEDARVTEPTRVQPQPTGEEDDLRKGLEKAETPSVAAEAEDKGSIATAIALVSFFAILSVLIGLIIYKRDEIMEFISEKTGSKESKPLSEYDKVKSYILNELNSGFTIDQIKEKLEEVGWQKELIELVMRDIKKNR